VCCNMGATGVGVKRGCGAQQEHEQGGDVEMAMSGVCTSFPAGISLMQGNQSSTVRSAMEAAGVRAM
jgi:hypothetical protein